MFYSTLKDALAAQGQQGQGQAKPGAASAQQAAVLSTTAAGLAGMCSSTLTFPLDKVRRMMQVRGVQGVDNATWRRKAGHCA